MGVLFDFLYIRLQMGILRIVYFESDVVRRFSICTPRNSPMVRAPPAEPMSWLRVARHCREYERFATTTPSQKSVATRTYWRCRCQTLCVRVA